MKYPIITNLNELHKPCLPVTSAEEAKQLEATLIEALNEHPNGMGLSANQIGIQKRISIIRYDKFGEEVALTLINAKITEKAEKFHWKEECLSLPHVAVEVGRWGYIKVECVNTDMEPQTLFLQGLQGTVAQHELDHQQSMTILDRKYRAR